MRLWLVLFAYGALSILGTFHFLFWTSLTAKRVKKIAARWTITSDRYFMLAAAIATASLGNTTVWVTRTIGNIYYGLSPIAQAPVEGAFIVAGLALCLVGNFMVVWLADLERSPPIWTWVRWLSGAVVLWGIVVALYANGVINL